MAEAIAERDWTEVEESVRRDSYWQYLVKRWLYQAPFAVMPRPAQLNETSRRPPTPQALQDFGWILVPESQVSH